MQNAPIERAPYRLIAERRTAHREFSPNSDAEDLWTAGPSSGNLFVDLEGEGLARECMYEGVCVVPADEERVSFAEDIKPLFRPMDHESMAWAFDLASYDEVKENATAILERLRDGSMPCDGEWPDVQVERFQRWTDTGMHE